MKEKNRYLLLLFIFPLFFWLHGINENFGLIPVPVLFQLLLKYFIVTALISGLSWILLKNAEKFVVFAFLLLLIYFFFGAAKDFLEDIFPSFTVRYKYVIPLMAILLALTYLALRKMKGITKRVGFYLCTLLIVLAAFDAVVFISNIIRNKSKEIDMGDRDQQLIQQHQLTAPSSRPTVFWLVFDEYPSAISLKKGWGYTNPLDSMLLQRGFYIADSAKSNYNFTHYSLTSTLDMAYLNKLQQHSEVTIRDLVRGNMSLAKNNVTTLFESQGYNIQNFTIYNLDKYPTKGILSFAGTPRTLIDHQTLDRRLAKDIGWNFINFLKADKKAADSIFYYDINKQLDGSYKQLISNSEQAFRTNAQQQTPSFFMLHFLLPHEPFFYRADGSFGSFIGGDNNKEAFLEQLKYTNTLLQKVTDSILSMYAGKEITIIIQGDHGYKFAENDPLFEEESCRILYAVYNNRKNYQSYYPGVSSVNGFRIFFNDYFGAGFPLLPDSSFNLFYR